MSTTAEFERRVHNTMNRCSHFNGIQNETCKANVNYRQLVGGPDFGWAKRLPCFEDDDSSAVCELLSLPTEAEARAIEEEHERRIAEFLEQIAQSICPICKVQVRQSQVGHCVYGSCGHRLYQGKVNPQFAEHKIRSVRK